MMLRFVILMITLIFQLSAVSEETLAGYAPQTSDKPSIGVILPFSSAFEDIAVEQQRAVKLALAQSDLQVDIVFKDGGADKKSAVKAFKELADSENPPLAVISCSSWASDAIHPLAAQENIFHSAIGSAAINRTSPGHTVRFTLNAEQEQRQLAEYLSSFERVAVMAMDNDLGNSWMNMLRQKFADNIVAAHVYDPQQMNITDKLDDIRDNHPDALVLISAGEAARIARSARKAGIQAQLVGTRPVQRSELLDASHYTNGLVYTYPSYNSEHHFISDFQKTYGEEPAFFGVEAYDAATTLIQALENGLSNPDELFQWYAGNKFTGALGRIEFDRNGDARYPYLYKEIKDGKFQVADFQFPMLLETVRQQIMETLRQMDKNLAIAAEKLSAAGLKGRKAEDILQDLYESFPHAYNCVTVDDQGIIVNVAPDEYKEVIGQDISKQEQIIRLHETRKPVLSQAILMVEGFVGIDMEYPVFNKDRGFTGSVSILAKPGFLGSIISPKIHNFPVEIFVIQKDGTTIYDINQEEIGKNAFDDEIYKDYPSLIETAEKMVEQSQGKNSYNFQDRFMDQAVDKYIIWTTIGLHGTEYRLALTWSEHELQMTSSE
ncbi:MAG: ABC transporter substrate-binding protein [Desulfonatronovibrio sp.]